MGAALGEHEPDAIIKELENSNLEWEADLGKWLPIPRSDGRGPPLTDFNNATDLQLGAHLLLVSARAGVNVLEIFDFLLGFGGLDIAGDDPED